MRFVRTRRIRFEGGTYNLAYVVAPSIASARSIEVQIEMPPSLSRGIVTIPLERMVNTHGMKPGGDAQVQKRFRYFEHCRSSRRSGLDPNGVELR